MPPATHAVTVLLDDELLVVNRVIGVIRRRNLPLAGLGIGATRPGVLRLSFLIEADEMSAERLLRQLEKAHGVREAAIFAASEAVTREVALIRVRAAPAQWAAVRATVAEHGGVLVDEGPDGVIVEVRGDPEVTASFIRALERFGVLEVARSGAVLVRRPGAARSLTQPSEAVL